MYTSRRFALLHVPRDQLRAMHKRAFHLRDYKTLVGRIKKMKFEGVPDAAWLVDWRQICHYGGDPKLATIQALMPDNDNERLLELQYRYLLYPMSVTSPSYLPRRLPHTTLRRTGQSVCNPDLEPRRKLAQHHTTSLHNDEIMACEFVRPADQPKHS